MKPSTMFFGFGLAMQVIAVAVFVFGGDMHLSCAEVDGINVEPPRVDDVAGALLRSPSASSGSRSILEDNVGLPLVSKWSNDKNVPDVSKLNGTAENKVVVWWPYLIGVGVVTGLIGLILNWFRYRGLSRKRDKSQFHFCSSRAVLTPTLVQFCPTCDKKIGHQKIKVQAKSSVKWVIEITLSNSLDRRRVVAAIKQMNLSALRTENDYIIVGSYNVKKEAAAVVKKLHEHYSLRGWLVLGT